MTTFENWYTSILEEVATPTKTLVGDVDTIISSLDTLVKELTEEFDSPEFNELNEADGEAPSKVWQWIWWMPKARRAQQKVNKIKLNITDMEAAATDAPDKEQKTKIAAKANQAKNQAAELQKMVDDKYGAKGELVKKVIGTEKIAGQIAAIKRATGLEDNPEKIASYKEKMTELQAKYKEDQAAIAELEPSEEEKNAEKTKKKEEAEAQAKLNKDVEDAKKGKSGKGDAEAADDTTAPKKDGTEGTNDTTTPKTDATTDPKKDDTTTPKTDATTDPKKDDTTTPPAETDNTQKIATKTAEIQQLKANLATEEDKEPKDDAKISEIKGKIQTAEQELDALKNPPAEESLVIRANAAGLNELATEISSKFSWQVSRGTVLHQKYEEIIKKAEYSNKLNESRYQNLSIAEKFSRLM